MIILLAGAWLAGEIAIIPLANSKIENEVGARTQGVTTVDASIGSFPVATRVLITGEVSKLNITLERIARATLDFAEIEFDLRGIHVDRAAILRGETDVEDIDSGTVRATVDLGAIGRIASAGGIELRVDGRTLRAAGRSFALADDLIPCSPEATAVGETVILTCTIDEVPEILIGAVQP